MESRRVTEEKSKHYLELLLSDAKHIKAALQSNQARMLDIDVRSRANEIRLKIILSCIPPVAILGINILCEDSVAGNLLKAISEIIK